MVFNEVLPNVVGRSTIIVIFPGAPLVEFSIAILKSAFKLSILNVEGTYRHSVHRNRGSDGFLSSNGILSVLAWSDNRKLAISSGEGLLLESAPTTKYQQSVAQAACTRVAPSDWWSMWYKGGMLAAANRAISICRRGAAGWSSAG